MTIRTPLVVVLVGVFASSGASYRTTNFVVQAPTTDVARQVARAAEKERQKLARAWLGKEMPDWDERCRIDVRITWGPPGGRTIFHFDEEAVPSQRMRLEGPLELVLDNVLPHEVTHTVFASSFGCRLPRWADEGGAILCEDDQHRQRRDQTLGDLLDEPERVIPLQRLFGLDDYPDDVPAFYAQSYSLASFLVEIGDRPTFLDFVDQGMADGWNKAVRRHYRYRNVRELEEAWLSHVRKNRRRPERLGRPRF